MRDGFAARSATLSIGRPRVAGMFELMSAVLSLLRLPVPS